MPSQKPWRPRGQAPGSLRIIEEDGQTQKDERPVTGPAPPDRAGHDGEQTHGEDEEPRGVVVVFGPRAIGVGARGIGVVRGQLAVGGRHQPRKLRREDLSDLGQRRPIGDDVHGRGDGRQRGGREEHDDPNAEFDLHEAPHTGGGHMVGPVEPSDLKKVQGAQGEQAPEEHDLGSHHHAVGRSRHRSDTVDVGKGQRGAARDERTHRRQREGREARQEEARPGGESP